MIRPTTKQFYKPIAVSLFILIINFNIIQVVHAEESSNNIFTTIAQVDRNIMDSLGSHKMASEPATKRDIQIENEVRCLGLNIYFEARSESEQGKRAVGHVVMNRVANKQYPNTVCNVVQQGGEKQLYRCQFSWWCDGRSDKPLNQKAWQNSLQLANAIYFGQSKDPTDGALWYHADYVSPYWSNSLTMGGKIGQHIFYLNKKQSKYALN